MTYQFRNAIAATVFNQKYKHEGAETWPELCRTLVEGVCASEVSRQDKDQLVQYMSDMKCIPGGRYLYYAGRPLKYYNNCFLLRAEEDTRQDWADLSWKSENALMTGGGIGVDYSVYRPEGTPLSRTGGVASGPISKIDMINEIGRRVMQGGSRRSAIYASLNWQHPDAQKFIVAKDWHLLKVPGTDLTVADLKRLDFNWHAPLDMTNISLNYDTAWLNEYERTGQPGETFLKNTRQALTGAEPGFSFNFYGKERETLRNACCELTSEDDSDVCNLGSVNLGNIESLSELRDVTELMTKFLVCGTLRADLPYDKVCWVREKNRRIGLGLMGIHEWLLKRGQLYTVTPELHTWLGAWKWSSEITADNMADELGINQPAGKRAIAPTGTIGMLAGTTTGIEPIFAVAYKRRYLEAGHWRFQYVIDGTAKQLVQDTGCNPDNVETALDLAADPERRLSFQADVQDYVDHAISSTVNLPPWGDPLNNEDTVSTFASTLAKYAHRLRGATFYPDGARGGQPLTRVPYADAVKHEGKVFSHDICEISGRGGSCGV
jgi:ribonucleoside-diphosphate reductase alpha chain